jgi:hypothetical protein
MTTLAIGTAALGIGTSPQARGIAILPSRTATLCKRDSAPDNRFRDPDECERASILWNDDAAERIEGPVRGIAALNRLDGPSKLRTLFETELS